VKTSNITITNCFKPQNITFAVILTSLKVQIVGEDQVLVQIFHFNAIECNYVSSEAEFTSKA
jgi:hypothetical protein